MRAIVTNTIIVLLSLLLTLVACESVLRMLQFFDVLPVYQGKTIDKGDTPNRHVNAKLVRSENPVLFMEFDRNDPNINRDGFRGADFPPQKPADTVRIAILGDSVAYGYSVPLEQTFARLIENKLKAAGHKAEVLNFGVNGYSTVAELELYRTRVRDYRPDIVLLAYVLNDPLPAAFVVQSVGSARKQVDHFRQLARYSQLAAWCWLRWQALVQPFRMHTNYHRMYEGESWQNTVNALDSLHQAISGDSASFAVAVFPLLLDFDNYPMLALHQQVNSALSERSIPYRDLLQAFSQFDAMSLRPHPNDDTHPNAQGHEIAAREITALLLQLPPLASR